MYDDQFVYANDRYKMAGQWFALPKLFKASKNEGYQIVTNEEGLIQFRNEQVCLLWIFLPPSPAPEELSRKAKEEKKDFLLNFFFFENGGSGNI